MCCFSGKVKSVTKTKIFARLTDKGTQYLVYQMTYRATEPVAMILPLPVALPAREDAVNFVDLKQYPLFFRDMETGFPEMLRSTSRGGAPGGGVPQSRHLTVHTVGDFIASFVPTLNDFSRLDRQFVLPREVWNKIPTYNNYGFAVFQLRGKLGTAVTPHPMAFEFPTRMPKSLFFPTVHIHDGSVSDKDQFDHCLYFQQGEIGDLSRNRASTFMKIPLTQGMVLPDEYCRIVALDGNLPNQDTIIRV